jgi:hypothetical protein
MQLLFRWRNTGSSAAVVTALCWGLYRVRYTALCIIMHYGSSTARAP